MAAVSGGKLLLQFASRRFVSHENTQVFETIDGQNVRRQLADLGHFIGVSEGVHELAYVMHRGLCAAEFTTAKVPRCQNIYHWSYCVHSGTQGEGGEETEKCVWDQT